VQWFNFKKKETRIPYPVWEVRSPLTKPSLPINLIKKIHKIRKKQPERQNLFI
jgi:hypothetical protein